MPVESARVDVYHTLEPLLEAVNEAPRSENLLYVRVLSPQRHRQGLEPPAEQKHAL